MDEEKFKDWGATIVDIGEKIGSSAKSMRHLIEGIDILVEQVTETAIHKYNSLKSDEQRD